MAGLSARLDKSAVYRLIGNAITTAYNDRKEQIAEIAAKAADEEAAKIFDYLVTNVLGSSTLPPTLGQYVSWAKLNEKYVRYKDKKWGNSGYFEKTGEMRAEFGRLAPGEVALEFLGFTTVTLKKNSKATEGLSFKLPEDAQGFTISLKPYSNVSNLISGTGWSTTSNVGLAQYMDQELSRGFDKLMNLSNGKGHGGGPLRPLMLPTIVYFISDRIGKKVTEALQEAGFPIRWV